MTQTSAECTARGSWWWAEELPETRRALCKNKFEILVHLIGFTENKFITMHGHMNVKGHICVFHMKSSHLSSLCIQTNLFVRTDLWWRAEDFNFKIPRNICLNIDCADVFMLLFTLVEFVNFNSLFTFFWWRTLRIGGFQAGDEAKFTLMSRLGPFVTTRTQVMGPRSKCRQGIFDSLVSKSRTRILLDSIRQEEMFSWN